MGSEEVFAEVELWLRSKSVKTRALVDMGAVRSIMSKKLAEKLGFMPYEKPLELGNS